MNRFER